MTQVSDLAALHARLLKDASLQFDFTPAPVVKAAQWPHWLRSLAHWFGQAVLHAFPVLKIVFWVGVGAGVLGVLFLILRDGLGVGFLKRKTRPASRAAPADWRPEAWKARVLLEDADRLAAQGHFVEAAHLLLARSIEDIEARRPRLVRPALTARDIAALEALPASARRAFVDIARAVEAGWFGGRPMGPDSFRRCREAYEAFAFPDAWT